MTTINLNNCQPGDILFTRDGEFCKYVEKGNQQAYPHEVKDSSGRKVYYTNDGINLYGRVTHLDIVKIYHVSDLVKHLCPTTEETLSSIILDTLE